MSKLFTVENRDWVKGLVVAILGAVGGMIQSWLEGGAMDWKQVGLTALIAGIAYITKQFATDSNSKILGVVQV